MRPRRDGGRPPLVAPIHQTHPSTTAAPSLGELWSQPVSDQPPQPSKATDSPQTSGRGCASLYSPSAGPEAVHRHCGGRRPKRPHQIAQHATSRCSTTTDPTASRQTMGETPQKTEKLRPLRTSSTANGESPSWQCPFVSLSSNYASEAIDAKSVFRAKAIVNCGWCD